MFENLSIGHLAIVLVIVLLLFGAKRIPEIAGSIGNGIKEFKKTVGDQGNSSASESARDTHVSAHTSNVPPTTGNASLTSGVRTQAQQNAEREPKRLVR